MNKKNDTIVCKSVFKTGDNKSTAAAYTAKWIELINLQERLKKFELAG